MKVLSIEEDVPEKGLCRVEFDMTSEELNFFVEYAVTDILKKQIEIFNKKLTEDV